MSDFPAKSDNEINLRDYWQLLIKRRRLLCGIVCSVVFITAMVTLMQVDIYESRTVLLPLSQSQIPSPSSPLLGLFGIPQENTSDRLLAILQSRTLTETVMHNLGLLPILFSDDWDVEKQRWKDDKIHFFQEGIEALQEIVNIAKDEVVTVSIRVRHPDPVLATAIANHYVKILQTILNENAFTLAKKQRLFLEEQLKKTKVELTEAEEALQRFEREFKVVALDAQTSASVEALTMLESQIISKEVQLDVSQRFLTTASQEVYLLQEEIRALREQLIRLQKGSLESSSQPEHDILLPLNKAPDIKLDYTRLQRELLLRNKIFGLLTERFEQAKVDESHDETAFQIVDYATPPNQKVAPKRLISIVFSVIISSVIGILFILAAHFFSPKISSEEEILFRYHLPVIGKLPLLYKKNFWFSSQERFTRKLIKPPEKDTPLVKEFRHLYFRLKAVNCQEHSRVILCIYSDIENAVIAIANLGITSASFEEKTIIVHNDSSHFNALHQKNSFNNTIDQENTPFKAYQTQYKSLSTIPFGEVQFSALASLSQKAEADRDQMLSSFQENYDFTIVAYHFNISNTLELATLSKKVQNIYLILTCDASRLEDLLKIQHIFQENKMTPKGVIFIDRT